MDYKENFQKALEEGKVLVRRVFANETSTKNQVSVQLIQLVPNGGAATPNSERNTVIGRLQGIKNAGYTMVTVISSVSAEVAKQLGLVVKDYFETDEVVDFSKLFGEDVTIIINESTNPARLDALSGEVSMDKTTGQPVMWKPEQAKQNPSTKATLLVDGKAIYRNAALGLGTREDNRERCIFLQHNSETVSTGSIEAAKAVAAAIS